MMPHNMFAKLLAIAVLAIFCSNMVAVDCIPVQVVYTGEACDCPRKLDYAVNVPSVPRPKKYTLNEYGYRIEAPPRQGKTKVSYTFDFAVEEPRTPKPPRESQWNLYAKIDRIAVNKSDCVHDTPRGSRCGCGGTDEAKPSYRYVYKKLTPCRCQASGCQCNSARNNSPNSIARGNRRLKRDLQRSMLRRRKSAQSSDRPGRFVKLYRKSLETLKPDSLFELDGFDGPEKAFGKRKMKKAYLPRLVKRDIKGEYDLLEKERDQMDLTLPEIIQYMPETLQPTFKRGHCQFSGASARKRAEQPASEEPKDTDNDSVVETDASEKTADANDNDSPKQNAIPSAFTKRNAKYDYSAPAHKQYPAYGTAARSVPVPQLQGTKSKSACRAQHYQLPQIPTPTWLQQRPYPTAHYAYAAPQLPTARYAVEPYGHNLLASDRVMLPLDPLLVGDRAPLQYIGDLDGSTLASYDGPQLGAPQNYPVYHVSNEELDRIIADIIYRHPDFIDATAHYGGALVDPEPLQEQQTKEFLKKLIDGRLSFWFKEEEQHSPQSYISSYDSSPY